MSQKMDGCNITGELTKPVISGKKIAVLVSGSGSNLFALINAVKSKIINNAEVSLVISNKKDAYALEIAKHENIKSVYLQRSLFESDEEYDAHLVSVLKQNNIDIVLLAGYLRIISAYFIKSFENKILNIHPSLLPDFGGKGMYGIKVHQAVIDSNNKISGCSVHLVTKEIDGGRVLAQAAVDINNNETAKTLAAKVLEQEHILYPMTVNDYILSLK